MTINEILDVVACVFLPHGSFGHGTHARLATAAANGLGPDGAGEPTLLDAALGLLCQAGHASLNFNAISGRSGIATAPIDQAWTARVRSVVDAVGALVGDVHDQGDSIMDDCAETLSELSRLSKQRCRPRWRPQS